MDSTDTMYSVNEPAINNTVSYHQGIIAIVIQSALIPLIVLGSIFGNSLTLLAIWRYRTLQTKTSVFVASLAVADLLTCAITGPFIFVSTVTGEWHFSYPMCQLQGFCTVLFCAASINTLMYVAIDRYVAITDPFHYHLRLGKHIVLLFMAFTWLQSSIFAASPVFGWGKYVYIPEEYLCTCEWNRDVSFTITVITFNLLLPVCVTMLCYIHIFRVAREQSRKVAATSIGGSSIDGNSTPQSHSVASQSQTTRRQNPSQRRTETKAAKILFIVLGTFLICWIPHTVTIFCIALSDNNCNLPNEYGAFSTLLALTNSACNPVLYGILNRQMRKAYGSIIFRRRAESGVSVTSGFTQSANDTNHRRKTR